MKPLVAIYCAIQVAVCNAQARNEAIVSPAVETHLFTSWYGVDAGVASLAGKTIRLRIHLYNAKVFGIRGPGLELVRPFARK